VLLHFVQKYLVWFLVTTYALAATGPGPGLALRSVSGTIHLGGASFALRVPPILLAVLLFNASLGIDASELRRLGMSNNGSGLVLASASLSDHPHVMIVIVAYNLVQQLAAGFVDHLSLKKRDG
jgi:hypothetical protein